MCVCAVYTHERECVLVHKKERKTERQRKRNRESARQRGRDIERQTHIQTEHVASAVCCSNTT